MTTDEDGDASFFRDLEQAAKGLSIGSDVASAAELRRLLHEAKGGSRRSDGMSPPEMRGK
jgi:hypothetical protein